MFADDLEAEFFVNVLSNGVIFVNADLFGFVIIKQIFNQLRADALVHIFRSDVEHFNDIAIKADEPCDFVIFFIGKA
jgi:hypothetical protein